MDRLLVRKDSYHDSVFLMSLSAQLTRAGELEAGYVLLATPANRQLLERERFDGDALAALGPTDLVIALRAPTATALDQAAARIEGLLTARTHSPITTAADRPVGLDGGLARLPKANLALISVPGAYAGYEAAKALERGLHVMIFSDNVPLAEEVALKQRAAILGLLVMGPDCGTALVHGKPLGFANRVRRGHVGLVGASGTGLQEIACQIHRLGGGVSHILGTGGRDLCAAVGGITTLAAIDALVQDDETHALVVVSKPPAPQVAARVIERLAEIGKRSAVCFLGATAGAYADREPVHFARNLRHAAWLGCQLAAGRTIGAPDTEQLPDVTLLGERLAPAQRLVHGLFTGGTLGGEALGLLRDRGLEVCSNLDHDAAPATSDGHSVVDLGDDEFTRGRPHPMIEPALRNEWIERRGADPRTAVLLLDLVLGDGAHPDPAGVTAPALLAVRARSPQLIIVASVTGTELDPQGLGRQEARLRDAGVLVLPSNVAAAELAAAIALTKERR